MATHISEIKTKLDETLCRINRKYYSINCGGCGVFAKALGDTLEEMELDVKYVVVLRSNHYVESLKKDNSASNLWGTNWGHVMLEVDGKLIDSTGIFDKLEERYPHDLDRRHVEIPKQTLIETLHPDYIRKWNSEFDRKLITKILKDIYIGLDLDEKANAMKTGNRKSRRAFISN